MTDPVAIREARPAEAPALVALAARIDSETDFLPREPGERPPWARNPAAFQATGNSALFVAESGGTLLGYLAAHGGRFLRNRGAATLSVGVLRAWNGRGIATRLFAAAEDWAHAAGLHRLELTVVEDNARARALYERLGFTDEGGFRDSLRVKGAWRSERLMAKLPAAPDRPAWNEVRNGPTLDAPPPAPIGVLTGGDLTGGLTVRPAEPADAAAYFACDRAVRTETPFLMRTAAEALPDVAATRRFLAEQRIGARATTLVAVLDGGRDGNGNGGIAGMVSLWTGLYARTAHEAGLGIAVRRDYWGSGAGSRLMAAAEDWVRARGLHRLSLWVLAHNTRARRFYTAHGFVEEAVARRCALIDGRYADHVAMAKLYG